MGFMDNDTKVLSLLEGLATTVAQLQNNFTELTLYNAKTASHQAFILAEIAAMKSDINTMQSSIGTMQTDISKIEANQASMQTDISKIKTNQASMQADISKIETNQASMQADISKIKTNQASMQTDILSIKAQQIDDTEMLEIIIGQTAVLTKGQFTHGQEIEKIKAII